MTNKIIFKWKIKTFIFQFGKQIEQWTAISSDDQWDKKTNNGKKMFGRIHKHTRKVLMLHICVAHINFAMFFEKWSCFSKQYTHIFTHLSVQSPEGTKRRTVDQIPGISDTICQHITHFT